MWFIDFLNFVIFIVSMKDLLNYRIIYARWMQFCSLPREYRSLQRYPVVKSFGRKFLILLLRYYIADLQQRSSFIDEQV